MLTLEGLLGQHKGLIVEHSLLGIPLLFLHEQHGLGGRVAEVAGKEEHVSRLDSPCKAHEKARVKEQSGGHSLGNALSRFVCVNQTGRDESPVGGRAPKMDSSRANWRVEERSQVQAVCHFISVFY